MMTTTMPMMKKMIMVTFTVIVMVVIEKSKLLAIAIVGLKAFKHMYTSSIGGHDKINGNEFPRKKS